MHRYDPARSYDWNYEHVPEPAEGEPPPALAGCEFCGIPVDSPLGMPAGPLLNGRWVLYYAALGFDVLTYKTVRSRARACYPLPNLQPVAVERLSGGERELPAVEEMRGSWAISFGMPSRDPEVWRRDVEETRRRLAPGKVLSVSVVGTMQPGWGLEELAADYARCAAWAVESGADCVEANLSCPNVRSEDGQLYQQPEAAAVVSAAVRERCGGRPLVLKIGHVTEPDQAAALIEAVAPHAAALSIVNCLSATVQREGRPLFEGEPRGIGGAAVREASLAQAGLFARLIRERSLPLKLVGVGGISTAEHVRAYLKAGAHAVHIATAAMQDPGVGLAVRREL